MQIDKPSMPHFDHGNLSLADNAPIVTIGTDNPRVKIAQTNIANAATADFALPAGFSFYEFLIRDLIPVTGGTDLFLQVSLDGGASFAAGASDYAYALWGGDTTTAPLNQIDATASGILLNQTTQGLGTTGTQHYCGRVLVCNAFGTRMFPMVFCHSANIGSTGLQTFATSAGNYQVAGSAFVNGIRFILSAGNFERGIITLYGIK